MIDYWQVVKQKGHFVRTMFMEAFRQVAGFCELLILLSIAAIDLREFRIPLWLNGLLFLCMLAADLLDPAAALAARGGFVPALALCLVAATVPRAIGGGDLIFLFTQCCLRGLSASARISFAVIVWIIVWQVVAARRDLVCCARKRIPLGPGLVAAPLLTIFAGT